MDIQLTDYHWLTSDAAQPFLDVVATDWGSRSELQVLTSLRRDLSAERAALVVKQVQLRKRAAHPERCVGLTPELAHRLFYTPVGLQQATGTFVAHEKRDHFPEGESVLDFCCGIGGDLLPLAMQGREVVGVDRDEVTAHCARENLRVLADISEQPSVLTCEVRTTDVAEVPLALQQCWHLDPDRRSEGRRSVDPDHHSPPTEVVTRMLREAPNGAVKLSPASAVPDVWLTPDSERHWLQYSRECQQQMLWSGKLAWSPGLHSVTVARRGVSTYFPGKPGRPKEVAPIGRYLYEPANAIFAADLTGALAEELALAAIAAQTSYLTCNTIRETAVDNFAPLVDIFEVEDVLPFDRKKLVAYFREHRVGHLELKQRGTTQDLPRLEKELKLRKNGDERRVLLLTEVARETLAIVGQRAEHPPL